MWSLVFRLALLASSIFVAWNFARAWIAVLRAPKKKAALPKDSPQDIAAKVLVQEATRHVVAIEVAIAGLSDAELWGETEKFTDAVKKLSAAVLANPKHYRRAKRHLGQILIGAEQTARHFARHYSATPDPGTRRRFLALLGELSDAFVRAVTAYASAGAAELEVEAETLRELLRRNRRN